MPVTVASLQATVGLDASGLTMGIERARARIAELIASANQTNTAMGGMERTMAAASASTAFLGDAMMIAAERTTTFSDRQRQQTAFTRELTATRARLAEILAGEGNIASTVAAKYAGLSNVQRAQLIEAKEQIAAIELKARAQTAAAAAAKAAGAQAVQAAEAEAAAEVKAALAAGQLAAAEKGRAAAAEEAAAASRMGSLGTAGLIVGVGVATAVGEAVKASVEFNRAMANVGSLIPGNVQRLGELKGAVQDLAQETGKDTKEIATGAYQMISSFGDTADTAKILAINTKLAIGGVADIGKTIGLTAAVTKNYGDTSAEAVQHVADLAAMTVRVGHTTLPELNASMGQVAPLAHRLNISMDELFGTLATGSGVTGNMSRVATQLRGIFAGFANPTKTMVGLFNNLHVASGDALIAQRGLGGAIKAVVEESERTDTPLQKYFHRIEATTLAMALAGAQATNLAQKTDKMANSSGAAEAAFKAQQTGIAALGTEWAKLGQTLKVTAQTFGDVIAPMLTTFTKGINDYLQLVRRAGAATGTWLSTPQGPSLTNIPRPSGPNYQSLVEQGRARYLTGLQGGAAGQPVGAGGAYQAPPELRAPAPTATKAQLEAHQKIVSTMEAQAFDTVRAKAVLLHGELSNQVGALDLYRVAYEKLTGAQQHNVREFENNIKAELKAKDAVDAHKDAIKEAEKEQEKARREQEKRTEAYQQFIRAQQVGTRVAQRERGAGLEQFRIEHPDFTRQQAQIAYNAEQWRKHAEAVRADAEAQEKADQALRDTMEDQLKQAQLDAMSERAKRKFGEVNRESLAIDSQWHDHYAKLSPRQQTIIDQLYQLALEKELNAKMDKEFEAYAQAVVKQHEDRAKAAEKEKDALIELDKVLAARRREREKDKQDLMDKRLQEMSEQMKQKAEIAHDALVGYAHDFAGVFIQAFRDVQDHSKGFFTSIIQGFEKMLEEMALKYLESKIANLFFNVLDKVFGGSDPLNSWTGRASGGPVAPGQGYLVGEHGPELFQPDRPGRIMSNAQMAGGGGPNITFNISTPDVSGFKRSRSQLEADAYRMGQNSRKRNGG